MTNAALRSGLRSFSLLAAGLGTACTCASSPGQPPEPSTRPSTSTEVDTTPDTPHDSASITETDTGSSEIKWIDVAAGQVYTVGIREDGTLAFWGDDYFFDEGPPAGTFVSVIAGGYYACALRTDETIACWGCDGEGLPPSVCNPPAGSFSSLYSGSFHACAVSSDTGDLVCWGLPNAVPTDVPDWPNAVALGHERSCALDQAGSIAYCWGSAWLPDWIVDAPTVPLSDIALGPMHACGLDLQGNPVCWGTRVLYSPYEEDHEPYPPCPFEGPFVDIVSKNRATCVLDANGFVQCWTAEAFDDPVLTPPEVPFTKVSVGAWHACGLTADGDILCWGRDEHGELNPPG